MKAILLCAGYATRLYPLTKNHPKPLLPLAGRPILDYLLDKLKDIRSIDQVIAVTNERFLSHFQDWAGAKKDPWKIDVVSDGTSSNETRLGAIGDLSFVVKKFQLRDDLGIFAGDNLFMANLKGFLNFAESNRPHSSLGIVDVKKRELAPRYGIVRINSNHQIIEFVEKPAGPPSTLASTGVYWFAKESLNFLDRYIREGHNADRPGDYIRWLVEVDRVFAHRFEGHWYDIGDLDSYREAEQLVQQQESTPQKRKERNEK